MLCCVLLLLVPALLTACQQRSHDTLSWSAQRSVNHLHDARPSKKCSSGSCFGNQHHLAEQVDRAYQSAESIMPDGVVSALLAELRGPLIETLSICGDGVKENATGIIMLGGITGPDGTPMSREALEAAGFYAFFDQLQLEPAIGQRWFIATHEDDLKQIREQIDMKPGETATVRDRRVTFDPHGIFFLKLEVAAKPGEDNYGMSYSTRPELFHLASRTSVQGLDNLEMVYYYQPFMDEWISSSQERRRRGFEGPSK